MSPQKDMARAAVDAWDGVDTAELILDIIDRTGEDVRETLEEARYKWDHNLYPAPCMIRLYNAGKPAPRTCERCILGPCVYGETTKP